MLLIVSDLAAIKNIFKTNKKLVNAKMWGYGGADIKGVIKQTNKNRPNRCYFYTGQERDGYFYPMHVAAEAGHKKLTILLQRAGADMTAVDYTGALPEDKATGGAQHAFYELKGFKFEAKERYQGKFDRQGNRSGQGVLFFKPEGYTMEEKQLYRGSFKSNLFHGHGNLYWPGTDQVRYTGRFRNGIKNGRGIDFDQNGKKVYQGSFRDDMREGRGEEFIDGQFVYKGEFANNRRHGFGAIYFGGGGGYFGRIEDNNMSGLGVYCHANGDRFEGMFFNNRPDGLGSFYEHNMTTREVIKVTHAQWQTGRPIKDLQEKFAPTAADLPDDSSQNMFSLMMNKNLLDSYNQSSDTAMIGNTMTTSASSDMLAGMLTVGEDAATVTTAAGVLDALTTTPGAAIGGDGAHGEAAENVVLRRLNFSYFDNLPDGAALPEDQLWKVQLGKYLKLHLREAIFLGLPVAQEAMDRDNKAAGDSLSEEVGVGDEDMDEVNGYHFVECSALFVCYVYVLSASKIFEDRLVSKGDLTEYPDFEAAYHLVMDAVDNYNELWDNEFKLQQQNVIAAEISKSRAAAAAKPAAAAAGGFGAKKPSDAAQGTDTANTTAAAEEESKNAMLPATAVSQETRRHAFLSDKEKKEELILKQRAELALKKGTAELDSSVEKTIAKEVMNQLEFELSKLIIEDMVQGGKAGGHIAPATVASFVAGSAAEGDNSSRSASPSSVKDSEAGGSGSGGGGGGGDDTASQQHQQQQQKKKESVQKIDFSHVNIEDLFDIDFLDSNLAGGTENDDANLNSDEIVVTSNEFAAELLYIMKTAIALT